VNLRWPSWRFDKRLDAIESEETIKKVQEAKAEAVEALSTSYTQLEEVRELTKKHEPVRLSLKDLRERNRFAEGLMRVIEEGR
jgi:hypothetical protein